MWNGFSTARSRELEPCGCVFLGFVCVVYGGKMLGSYVNLVYAGKCDGWKS